MKKVFAARNQNGKIIFVGTGTEKTCETLQSCIGDFESLGELKGHPQVNSIEVAKPVNESVAIAETEIEGGVLLSRSEHIVFSILYKKLGELVPRKFLMTTLQKFGDTSDENMTMTISRLRKKIRSIGYLIFSEYGKGYILKK